MKKIRYWIMKSEPSEFGIDDLEKRHESFWDGIRNYQVRNMIRDVMAEGDKALFYHSSCKDVGVVGEMEIVSTAKPDPSQFDKKSKYYDAKSLPENPRWLGVVVRHHKTYKRLVSLANLRSVPELSKLKILQAGNRLSITEISREEFSIIKKLSAS